MRLNALVRHLHRHGCYLLREGGNHSIWINPETGDQDGLPRHSEIDNHLARRICRNLSVPEIGR